MHSNLCVENFQSQAPSASVPLWPHSVRQSTSSQAPYAAVPRGLLVETRTLIETQCRQQNHCPSRPSSDAAAHFHCLPYPSYNSAVQPSCLPHPFCGPAAHFLACVIHSSMLQPTPQPASIHPMQLALLIHPSMLQPTPIPASIYPMQLALTSCLIHSVTLQPFVVPVAVSVGRSIISTHHPVTLHPPSLPASIYLMTLQPLVVPRAVSVGRSTREPQINPPLSVHNRPASKAQENRKKKAIAGKKSAQAAGHSDKLYPVRAPVQACKQSTREEGKSTCWKKSIQAAGRAD